MDTCDECGAWVPDDEMTDVLRPDGTVVRLCRACYERGEYADEDEAQA